MEVYDIIKLLKEKCKDFRYYYRYVKFLKNCDNNNKNNQDIVYTEKHHILPVSLFPDFSKDKNNIIILTGRQHFLAHWMLAKATRTRSMWFAFNQMRRLADNNRSILYEYARIEIAKAISESNTGKIRSEEFCDDVSKRMKGHLTARNDKGECFWIKCDNPRLLSGELVHVCTGRILSDETKKKIGDGNRGTTYYIGPNKDVRLFISGEEPEDYMEYKNPQWFESTCSETIWVHNPETGKQYRLTENTEIPRDCVLGRHPDKTVGFSKINKSGKKKIIDLEKKCYIFLALDDINKIHQIQHDGQKIEDIIVFCHNNNIVIGYTTMLKYLHSIGIYIDRPNLNNINGQIRPPHHNNTDKTRVFREKYHGKTLSELGIEQTTFIDFDFDESKHILIHI